MNRFVIARCLQALAGSGLALALGACSHESQSNPPATQAAPATTPSNTTVDVSSLNDAQIAAVMDAINAGEIQEGQLAERAAAMPQVRQYAKQMVTAHQTLQTRLNAAYSRSQVTPSPNALSNQIQSDAHSQLSSMQSLRGKDFDRVFLDDQVRLHNNALELLDRAIPNVRDPQLKAQVQEARTRVDGHLREAEILQQQVQQGATNRQGPTRPGTMNVSPEGNPAQMR